MSKSEPSKPKDLYAVLERVREGAHCDSLSEYHDLYQKSIQDPDTFWSKQAKDMLVWQNDFHQVQHCDLKRGLISWFLGGTLNVSENCIDRHIAERG